MKKAVLLFLVILIPLCGFFISQKDSFLSPLVINEDVRIDYYMHRFHNSSLFKNDYFADSLSLTTLLLAPGYYLVYFLMSKFTDVNCAHKIISFLLFMLSSFFIFKIGSAIKDKKTGFFMLVLFVFYFWLTADYSGGTRNIFGKAILIIFIYYAIKRNFHILILSLILTSLFYSPISPVLFLTAIFLSFDLINKEPYFKKRQKMILFAVIFLILLLTFALYYFKIMPISGETFDVREISNMEIFGDSGRVRLFPFTSLLAKMKEYFLRYKFMSLSLIGLLLLLKERMLRLPKPLYLMLLSGALMYQLAIYMAFKLYTPSTFLDYIVPIFLIALCSYGLALLSELSINRNMRVICIASFLIWGGFYHYHHLDSGLTRYEKEKLYRFISSLPADSMLCGHPQLMDEVAFFGKRKFFVSKEFCYPVLKNYYYTVEARTKIFFLLYYGRSADYIYSLCKNNSIDYIIVEKKHFEKSYLQHGKFYFEPFNSFIRKYIGNGYNFVLKDVPEELKIYSDEERFIIKTEDLMRL